MKTTTTDHSSSFLRFAPLLAGGATLAALALLSGPPVQAHGGFGQPVAPQFASQPMTNARAENLAASHGHELLTWDFCRTDSGGAISGCIDLVVRNNAGVELGFRLVDMTCAAAGLAPNQVGCYAQSYVAIARTRRDTFVAISGATRLIASSEVVQEVTATGWKRKLKRNVVMKRDYVPGGWIDYHRWDLYDGSLTWVAGDTSTVHASAAGGVPQCDTAEAMCGELADSMKSFQDSFLAVADAACEGLLDVTVSGTLGPITIDKNYASLCGVTEATMDLTRDLAAMLFQAGCEQSPQVFFPNCFSGPTTLPQPIMHPEDIEFVPQAGAMNESCSAERKYAEVAWEDNGVSVSCEAWVKRECSPDGHGGCACGDWELDGELACVSVEDGSGT